ncbi:MAG: hypothetical protein WAU01_09155 [Saprospiraceae bacterium]
MSFLIGILLGAALLIVYNIMKGEGEPSKDVEKIFAAVPESQKGNESEYIIKSIQFNDRIQAELDSYNRPTSISRDAQKLIAGGLYGGSKLPNTSPTGDTMRGINFDIIPLIKSLLNGQNKKNVSDLTLSGYGIYVALGRYPAAMFPNFPFTEDVYKADYSLRKTAFINYTISNTQARNLMDSPSYTFLNADGGSDSSFRLADNIGNVCPPNCPPPDEN